jgi:hypothetical protein
MLDCMRESPPVRRLALLLVVPLLAGCGSSKQSSPTTMTQQGAVLKSCSSLHASDVERVASISPVNRRDLSRQAQAHLLCATVFFDASGDLVVEITEAPGGRAALSRLRASSVDQFGQGALRAMSRLGQGAFLARRRILAFARSGRLVTLQTGYGSQGRLSLTADQLTRLARLAASRR